MNKLNQIFIITLMVISFNCFAGNCPALSGAFTIGKSEGADFSSVSEAVAALQCGGVAGAVTFNMESGTYNERVVMSTIPGASAVNNITFQSKSGTNTDVVIDYSAADATLIMNGTQYVSFQNMSVNHSGSTYGNAARMDGKVSDLHFSGVVFDGVEVARTGANSAVVYFTSSAVKTNISFENCDIYNGSVGIFKSGMNAAGKDSKTSITGTLFFNQFESGLVLTDEDAPVITNNVISSLSNFSSFKGIALKDVSDALNVGYNVITTPKGSIGIEMMDCVASEAYDGHVTGNAIALGGNDEASGILLSGTTNNQVLNFNRVKLSNGKETINQAYYRNSSSGGNVDMMNNIFFDTSSKVYTIVGNTNKDVFNQLPGQSNSSLTASANGIMIEKVTPLR